MRWALLLIFLFAASPLLAQEIHLLGGMIEHRGSGESSYSWQMEYRQALGDHFAASLSYLNEGHLPNHHRDGHAIQLWANAKTPDRRLTLGAGAGPYYFYDTTNGSPGKPSVNDHGWEGMLSLSAVWRTESRWLYQLRANWVGLGSSFGTLSAVAGIGYQLESPQAPEPRRHDPYPPGKPMRNELTLFLGQTIVNSLSATQHVATSIEYRRGIWRYADWSVAWIYEGDRRLVRRNGIASQLWAVRPFLGERLTLGAGAGAYLSIDHYHDLVNGNATYRFLSGIFTLTGSYRLDPHWALRASWNRIITKYNMDTDVILGGVGLRF